MLLGLARKGSETSSEMKIACGLLRALKAVVVRSLRVGPRCPDVLSATAVATLAATAAEHMHLFDIVAVVDDDDDDDAIANSWSPRSGAPLGRARSPPGLGAGRPGGR